MASLNNKGHFEQNLKIEKNRTTNQQETNRINTENHFKNKETLENHKQTVIEWVSIHEATEWSNHQTENTKSICLNHKLTTDFKTEKNLKKECLNQKSVQKETPNTMISTTRPSTMITFQ